MRTLKLWQLQFVFQDLAVVRREHIARIDNPDPHLGRVDDALVHIDLAMERAQRLSAERAMQVSDVKLRDRIARNAEAGKAVKSVLSGVVDNLLAPAGQRAAARRLLAVIEEARLSDRPTAGERMGQVQAIVGVRETTLAADLAAVPAVVGDLLDIWVATAEAMARLKSGRSADGQEVAPELAPLEVVHFARSVVGKLRRAIRVSLENNPALPADLEGLILGYFDEFNQGRKSSVEPESDVVDAVEVDAQPEARQPLPVHGPELHVEHS